MESDLEKGNILIVEDGMQTANLMKHHLNREGYKVTLVENGLRAWDILQQNQLDLILLDEEMPGMSGRELLKKIRTATALQQIPVIFASGSLEEDLKKIVFQCGANDYMSKPFSGKELTIRVNYQMKIAGLQKELREKTAQLQSILDNTVDAIITFDENARIESFNLAAERVFGWRSDEIIGRSIELLIPISILTEPGNERELLVSSEMTQIVAPGRRVEGRRRDGTSFLLEIGVSKVLMGDSWLFIALLRNITELVRAETELACHQNQLEDLVKAQTTKLTQSNQMLKAFTWSASHDLQEPLRKIITFANFLNDDYGKVLNPRGRRYIKQIAATGRKMREFVDAQLLFSLLEESGRSFQPVDLSHVLTEVLDDLELLIMETDACITYSHLPQLNANAFQIRQLLYNLLLNSLTFCRKDVVPKITIRHRSAGSEYWEIVVRDNGIGFDEQYREQIFYPFKRLHGKDDFPGSGMGLAICRRVVEYHKGRIFAQSTPEHGSMFFVRLPASPPATGVAGVEAPLDQTFELQL